MGTKTKTQTTASERTTEWQSTIVVGDGSTVTTMVSGRDILLTHLLLLH